MPDNNPVCVGCNKREGIAVPVVIVPILNYPQPTYLRYKGALCNQCASAFTMRKFEDEESGWYEAACDRLRSIRKPAANPFPNDPSFKFEEFIIKPDWEPAPKEQCRVVFWKPETLAAKGARASWEGNVQGRQGR